MKGDVVATHGASCGTSGEAYANLTEKPVELVLAVSGSEQDCQITFSWIDSSGQSRSLTSSTDSGGEVSEGATTTLAAGKSIRWASSRGGTGFAGLSIDEVPTKP